MKKIVVIALLLVFMFAGFALAASVDCSSASTVQTAITAASDGDTVICDASGSYSWTSDVTIPNTKYLTLDLNDATITISGSGIEITINAHATSNNRLTNGSIVRGDGHDPYTGTVIIGNGTKDYGAVVIDNITFSGSYVLLQASGAGPALVYSCTFSMTDVNQETIHVLGGSWVDADSPGTANAFYLEDNVFNGTSESTADCALQGYYGSRVVARYNTLNGALLEQHGTAGNEGVRFYEIYKNTFTGDAFICIRAGSGIIFDNSGEDGIVMVEEDTGYPADYQVGRGQNQTLYPAYVWGNTTTPSLNEAGWCSSAIADMIQLNRDVYYPTSGTTLPATCTTGQGYWKSDEGGNWDTTHGSLSDGMLYKCIDTNTWSAHYVPYTYPHPVRGMTPPNVNASGSFTIR